MDVSIAVSLIRGQMGAVVERAVNGAVETVLAEMLKVVGVKFEELKSQVVVLKRDISTLQREKALKEKETDNIRAKLRYTELKLKYYRQGVEEELQQRSSAPTLVRIHPPSFPQTQRGGAGVSPTDASPSRMSQPVTRRNQECTSSQSTSCHAVRAPPESLGVATADSSNLQLPVSLPVGTSAESLDISTVLLSPTDAAKRKVDQDDCEWTLTIRPHTGRVDTVMVPPPAETPSSGQSPVAGPLFPACSTQADSSTLPPSATQVKQEAQQPREEEEEEVVICIKEEPEEEQEVTATLLLNCQVEQDHLAESETQMQTTAQWSGCPANHTTVMSSAGQNTYPLHQMVTSIPSMVALQPGIPPRQAVRPWTKDLSLYEEYKLRRNELRRRSLSRRRELEKSLPQPLLADMVRERREKTRLRVARWRAKRKLQACLNQAQAQGVTAGISPAGFPISGQHEGLRLPCASTSSTQPGSTLLNMSAANISAALPFQASSSSNLLLRGTNVTAHEHTVSSSSPYPQVGLLQQSISLVDTEISP